MTKKIAMGFVLLAALLCTIWAFAQQGTQAPPVGAAPGRGQAPGVGPGGQAPARGVGGGGGARGGGVVRTKKMLIAWNDERNGTSPHQSSNHVMAQMERLGYETGLWDTYIRSDSHMISFNPKMTTGKPNNSGINLSKADAIFALGYRDIELEDSQKADLISFIKDGGKGFVGSHMAATMFEQWPEYHKILGGWYDGHAYGTIPVPIVNEDPNFPAMKHIPATFTFTDEWYAMREWSRDNIRVLLRIDMSKLPGNSDLSKRFPNGDFPVAWAQMYGKGRVFYSTLAHASDTFDNPLVYQMFFEAIKWSMGLTDGDATPRPLPAGVLPPPPAPATPAGAPPAR
jgi:type 1 glutamine amidotransferase